MGAGRFIVLGSLMVPGMIPFGASAATIIQTINIDGGSGGGSHQAVIGPIDAFDTSEGTLSAVTTALAGILYVPESPNNGFSFPLTLNYTLEIASSGYGKDALVQASGSSTSYPNTSISGSGSSPYLGDFIGSNPIQLYFSQTESVINGVAGAPLFAGAVVVTYTYSSAIPEPPAAGLLGLGLIALISVVGTRARDIRPSILT